MDRQLSDNAQHENSRRNRSGWWRNRLGQDIGHHQGGGVPVGNLDSSVTRMATSRYQTGVVQMSVDVRKISRFLSVESHALNMLSTAVLDIDLENSLYFLLLYKASRDEANELYLGLNDEERQIMWNYSK
jgi:hypothetical protein